MSKLPHVGVQTEDWQTYLVTFDAEDRKVVVRIFAQYLKHAVEIAEEYGGRVWGELGWNVVSVIETDEVLIVPGGFNLESMFLPL